MESPIQRKPIQETPGQPRHLQRSNGEPLFYRVDPTSVALAHNISQVSDGVRQAELAPRTTSGKLTRRRTISPHSSVIFALVA